MGFRYDVSTSAVYSPTLDTIVGLVRTKDSLSYLDHKLSELSEVNHSVVDVDTLIVLDVLHLDVKRYQGTCSPNT